MGALGYGLLENDSAADGRANVRDSIEEDLAPLEKRRPSEATAARLAAGVGLLLHLKSSWAFSPRNDFSAQLARIIDRHRPMFSALPPAAGWVLQEVRDGKGETLADRPGRKYSRRMWRAFYPDCEEAPRLGKRVPALFAHPESARFVQQLADRLVKQIGLGFRDRSMARGLNGYEGGEVIGALFVLLVIEPCWVDPDLFRRWWEQYKSANDDYEPDAVPHYEVVWRGCLRLALEEGIHRFSDPPRARLED